MGGFTQLSLSQVDLLLFIIIIIIAMIMIMIMTIQHLWIGGVKDRSLLSTLFNPVQAFNGCIQKVPIIIIIVIIVIIIIIIVAIIMLPSL